MPSTARRTATVLAASAALAATFAAPASAAPLTVETDAGTACTIDAAQHVGSGFLGLKPIDFKGLVSCSPAGDADAPVYEGGARLTSNLLGLGDVLPLDLGNIGGAAATPNSPSNVDAPPPPAGEGALFVCRLDPGYDCGSTGRMTGLPATPYEVLHFGTLTAPAGERWTTVPEGCEIGQTEDEDASAVSCISTTEPFTTG